MKSSNGLLIFFSSIIIYWGLFIYYAVDIGMTNGEGVLGVMLGILLPLILLKWLHEQCDWDWQ